MDNIKYSITNVENSIFSAFIKYVSSSADFQIKEHSPVTEKCHFDRYTLLSVKEKCSVVYDIKAKLLTLTANADLISRLKEIFESKKYQTDFFSAPEVSVTTAIAIPLQKETVKENNTQGSPVKKGPVKNLPLKKAEVKSPPVKKERAEKVLPQKTNPVPAQTPSGIKPKPDKAVRKTDKIKSDSTSADSDLGGIAYKDGFSIKSFLPDRFDWCLKQFKNVDGYKIKKDGCAGEGSPLETVTYTVEDNAKQKVTVRYMTEKHVIQLQGKRSKLFSEVQIALSKDSDYNTVVKSHIELTGKDSTAGDIQKTLKKAMPEAYAFMTERVKSEFSIGLIDLNDDTVKVSDYSSLLLPPFRALEGFIKDLQRSKNIIVKQLGQAYEKEDGKYILKLGYRHKIKSIVFNEALSALYTLYFDIRNYYVHTDDDFSSNKIISDKAGAKEIFDNMVKIINYNAFKLTEIGFSLNLSDIKQDKK